MLRDRWAVQATPYGAESPNVTLATGVLNIPANPDNVVVVKQAKDVEVVPVVRVVHFPARR